MTQMTVSFHATDSADAEASHRGTDAETVRIRAENAPGTLNKRPEPAFDPPFAALRAFTRHQPQADRQSSPPRCDGKGVVRIAG